MAVTRAFVTIVPPACSIRAASFGAHAAVVDDPRVGDVDRADARGVGLQLVQPVAADDFARHAVGLAALVNPLEGRQLFFVDGDDHLAANFVGDALLLAELDQGLATLAAVDRLERAGLVVDARVNHARVAARLVCSEAGLFFEHDDFFTGIEPLKLITSGEADDAAADDCDVALGGHERDSARFAR